MKYNDKKGDIVPLFERPTITGKDIKEYLDYDKKGHIISAFIKLATEINISNVERQGEELKYLCYGTDKNGDPTKIEAEVEELTIYCIVNDRYRYKILLNFNKENPY